MEQMRKNIDALELQTKNKEADLKRLYKEIVQQNIDD